MKMNILKKLVVWVVIATFLWSNIIWAGGVEWYKLSAPSQVTSIVPIADTFVTGQKVVRQIAEEGIRTKDEFYKRLGEEIKKGRLDYLSGIPCLVFSDQQDETKLAYYVFSPKESYFSRITTDPSVNDSLRGFLKTIGIQERGEIGAREFKIGEKLYNQRVYILTDEELGLINTCLKSLNMSIVSSRLGVKREVLTGKTKIDVDRGTAKLRLYEMVNKDEIRRAIDRLKETHPRQWKALKNRTHDFENFFFFRNLPSSGGICEVEYYRKPEHRYVFGLDNELRDILKSGKLDSSSLEDFYYLLILHEGIELLLREGRDSCETISPDIETEAVAFIEEARVYLGWNEERRNKFKELLRQFDANEPNREDRFMPVMEFIETLKKGELEKVEGVLRVIDFILTNPDYAGQVLSEEEKNLLAEKVAKAEDIKLKDQRRDEELISETKNYRVIWDKEVKVHCPGFSTTRCGQKLDSDGFKHVLQAIDDIVREIEMRILDNIDKGRNIKNLIERLIELSKFKLELIGHTTEYDQSADKLLSYDEITGEEYCGVRDYWKEECAEPVRTKVREAIEYLRKNYSFLDKIINRILFDMEQPGAKKFLYGFPDESGGFIQRVSIDKTRNRITIHYSWDYNEHLGVYNYEDRVKEIDIKEIFGSSLVEESIITPPSSSSYFESHLITLEDGRKIRLEKTQLTVVAIVVESKHETSRDLHNKNGTIGKVIKGDEIHAELWQVDVKGDGLENPQTLNDKHEKCNMVNKELLEEVLKRLCMEYGSGILAVVDAIRVVDNIPITLTLSDPRPAWVPRGRGVRRGGG